jgi:hypothetical protein
MGRGLNWILDVGALTVTALVGIIAAGRALDTELAHRADRLPVVGDVVIGLRNAVGQVYDPTRLP